MILLLTFATKNVTFSVKTYLNKTFVLDRSCSVWFWWFCTTYININQKKMYQINLFLSNLVFSYWKDTGKKNTLKQRDQCYPSYPSIKFMQKLIFLKISKSVFFSLKLKNLITTLAEVVCRNRFNFKNVLITFLVILCHQVLYTNW